MKWRNVLQSGGEWGTLATSRTGVAGLLPLRHFGPDTSPALRALAFRGHFDYSLDAKNRLNVPPKFRAAFSSGVVLAKALEPCVAIWTPDAFERHTDAFLAGLNPLSAERRKLTRFFAGGSFDSELDSAGRVTLNPALLSHGGISKDVVLVGVIDHLQVWDREKWLADQDELSAEIVEIAESLGNPS
jgi:transcriptional regulator MraZ